MPLNSSERALVLTGVTAGFGEKALELLLHKSTCPIVIGARNPDRVPNAVAERATVQPLDLASLRSVADFCTAMTAQGTIGGLVLNAGLSPRTLRLTEDGIDLAFQTNYLGHFAILQALWDQLADDAHIVITSSGTHDPEEKTPPPPPRHADACLLAWPTTDPDLDKSRAKDRKSVV